MNNHHTKLKGDTALSYAIFIFTQKGYFVSLPISENAPYDLIVEAYGRLYRVQVKMRKECLIPNKTTWSDKNGLHKKYIDESSIDLFFMSNEDCSKYCIVPSSYIGKTIHWDHIKSYTPYMYYEDYQSLDVDFDNPPKRQRDKFVLDMMEITELDTENEIVNFLKEKIDNSNSALDAAYELQINYEGLLKFMRKHNIKKDPATIIRVYKPKVTKPRSKNYEWPDNQSLAEMIKTMPMTKVAEQIGCSDNAVRKHCRRNGIDFKALKQN